MQGIKLCLLNILSHFCEDFYYLYYHHIALFHIFIYKITSKDGARVFGEEAAKGVLAHAEAVKASGAKYCDCAACAACEAILEKKEEI